MSQRPASSTPRSDDRTPARTADAGDGVLAGFVRAAPVGLLALDRAGRVQWCSPAAAGLLGREASELLGAGLACAPRDVAAWERAVAGAVDGTTADVLVVLVDEGGGEVECLATLAPLPGPGDAPSLGVVVALARPGSRELAAREHARRELRESEARYCGVVEDQTELVCRFGPDLVLTFVNRAFAGFHGRTPAELVGRSLLELVPSSRHGTERAHLTGFGPDRTLTFRESEWTDGEGSRRWIAWTERAFLEPDGSVREVQAVGRDVTDRRGAQLLVAQQAEVLELVARSTPLPDTLARVCRLVEEHGSGLRVVVLLVDEGGSTLRPGAAPGLDDDFLRILDGWPVGPGSAGFGLAAHRGVPVVDEDLAADPSWGEYRAVARRHGVAACWSTPVLSSDGEHVLAVLAVLGPRPGRPDPRLEQVVALLAHVTAVAIERVATDTALAHAALHDPLTGLPNRSLFLDRVAHALARAPRLGTALAVLFVDLDRFQVVNDGFGHAAGDALLGAVAQRLQDAVRPGDTVARFGGDEFAVLGEDLPVAIAATRAADLARRIREALEVPVAIGGAETFVSASIGAAIGTDPSTRPEELIRDADAAMHHAKAAGPGGFEVFADAMRRRAVIRHATESALHRALDRGELTLFFQPVVDLATGRCTGAEALVRWRHPERGLVVPRDFIGVAEETGLIVPIGAWVLHEAARHAARWRLEGGATPFTVSVNLSAHQLAAPELVDAVAATLATTGVRPQDLCFEITESVLMEDVEATTVVVDRLRDLGVSFAIDDFGTGFSSLGYLKQLRVDAVKIDRSFVAGLGIDADDEAIVAAVVSLAHALGLKVVAEGVETEAQLTALVGLRCDAAQGFFFAPPQPVADVVALVGPPRRWRPPGARLIEQLVAARPR